MMEKVEEENNNLHLRIGEIYSYANQQFVQLESATQSEMQSMTRQLQLLNAELTAAKQEDEGATYRIEELERYKLMSDETSSYLQQQYAALRTQFAEQMDHATTIVAQTGHGLKDQVDRLRHALENAEINARQESMAVSLVNEQACTLRVEMLEAVKQGQVMKNTMSVSIRKMETELDAADLKRDQIMLEFRSNLRQEQERLADCEHRLALEESQCHLDRARNESLQLQVATMENRNTELVAQGSEASNPGMRDMRVMGLRSELMMQSNLLARTQEQLTESRQQYHEVSCQLARQSSPSTSPLRGMMELRLQHAQEELQHYAELKERDEQHFQELKAENLDQKDLLEFYSKGFQEIGDKHERMLKQLDQVSQDPKFTGYILDSFHNEIYDRDQKISKMETELATQSRELDMTTFDAQRFMRMALNRHANRGVVVEYTMSAERQSELQAELNEGRVHQERREADQLRFKSEYKALRDELMMERMKAESSALRDELMMERMKAESSVALNTQHDAIEAAKKSFQDELSEAKLKMENDTKKLREDLKYAEERKDHYKNNFAQVEDRYLDEEKAYQAEADAFERLRNEYNKSVQDLKDMEKENEKSRSKISRREAEKIVIQDWPRVDGVESWKSEVIHEVCIASGDDDHDEWKAWLAPCFADTPDLVMLRRQSEKKFQSIDAKLAHGLRKMIDRAGNKADGLRAELRLKLNEYGRDGDYIKGRELLVMILSNFRSPDHREVLYNSHHLYMLTYYGDNNLEMWYNKWLDIVYNMTPDDRPSKNSLRDTFFRKIEDSKLMSYDISKYKTLNEGHQDRTYEYLLNVVKGYIQRGKQDRLVLDRERAVKQSLQQSRTTPAETDDTKTAAPSTKTKKEQNAAAASSSTETPKPKAKPKAKAASVLPTPSPKRHAADKKNKPGGRPGRSSSPVDKKKIFCNFHFNKGGCNKGDKCPYSHSKKVYDAKMAQKKKGKRGSSNDSSRSRGRRSSSSAKPRDVCWQWQAGKCKFGSKCRFKHEDPPSSSAASEISTSRKGKKVTPVIVEPLSDIEDDVYDLVYTSTRVASARRHEDSRKIRFDEDVDITLIPIDDYDDDDKPKGSYRDPSKPYRHCKLKDLTDDQAKADNMIGLVRARARGIIMDMHGAYRDVTEVRIILGPKFDMLISLDDDDDEGMTFRQEMIEHMPMKMVKSKSNMMCITLPILAKDRRFILDSGSGHDLISEKKAERMGLSTNTCEPITFHTANGSTSTNQQARIDIGTFDKAANAYILDDTPSVMSLGKRCMDEGYSFVWPSNQMPFLIDKEGKRIDLSLHDNIPYIDLGGDVLPLRGDAFTQRVHELLVGKGMESSTSHTVFIDGSSGDEIENTYDTCDEKKKSKRRKKKSRTRSVKSVPADDDIEGDDGELSYAPGTPYDGPAPDTDDEGEAPLPAPDVPPEPDPHPEGHGREEERRDEADEDDIEIDVVEGESRVAKRGTLKREAKSIEHKLTHKYKNPYCDSCVRAKMKHFKTRRGAYRRELKKFGDLITFDAVNTDKIHDDTLILEKEVLVVRDCFTGLIGAYPSTRMTSDDVVRAVKQFIGARKVREAYSDRAPQFDDAMFEMKIPIDHSAVHRSKESP
eukprot:s1489_g15.t1